MFPQLFLQQNGPGRSHMCNDNRVPSRVAFAMQFVQHVNDTITDPQTVVYDEDDCGDVAVRTLMPMEQSAYEQALRTIHQWLSQENDFDDQKHGVDPGWQTTPLTQGLYYYVPKDGSPLSGGILAVYESNGSMNAVAGENGRTTTVPISAFDGHWHGPIPLPPGTTPDVQLAESPRSSGH